MEEVGRRGCIDDLHVVFSSQREESLDACRAVLRALTLVAVRQQQNDTVLLLPLVFGGNDVLINDDLGAVDKVTELRFPEDERVTVGMGVAILVAHCCVLGK